MGLVDYSDSSECEELTTPRTKKQKTSNHQTIAPSTAKSELPPLPSAFHDLYASTVRVSASDDPTLHQGRKRVNPHKVGHWPSHLYIEWHPTQPERTTLTALLSVLQSALTPHLSQNTLITSFLTSDLGAPQPLHISLSRPIVLSTSQKDSFLNDLERSILSSGIAPFTLTPTGLQWHRTPESGRSFLVLRVTGNSTQNKSNSNSSSSNSNSEEGEGTPAETNPQLTALLRRANTIVTASGQPALYATPTPPPPRAAGNGSGSRDRAESTDVDSAFHISIAWSFASPSAELRRVTEEVFTSSIATSPDPPKTKTKNRSQDENSAKTSPEKLDNEELPTSSPPPPTFKDAVRDMRVRVEGIKAKIGNVVTHVPLPTAQGRRNEGNSEGIRGLFGV
ncbi:U6 snRNA phosphodiesterase Usb1 [Xylaria digitata]|nr:U6 snRNA phosphodiesterase Usb1 [Xylaria digitata]